MAIGAVKAKMAIGAITPPVFSGAGKSQIVSAQVNMCNALGLKTACGYRKSQYRTPIVSMALQYPCDEEKLKSLKNIFKAAKQEWDWAKETAKMVESNVDYTCVKDLVQLREAKEREARALATMAKALEDLKKLETRLGLNTKSRFQRGENLISLWSILKDAEMSLERAKKMRVMYESIIDYTCAEDLVKLEVAKEWESKFVADVKKAQKALEKLRMRLWSEE